MSPPRLGAHSALRAAPAVYFSPPRQPASGHPSWFSVRPGSSDEMTPEDLQRATDLPAVRGERLPRGRPCKRCFVTSRDIGDTDRGLL
jgi:hypothetical protein